MTNPFTAGQKLHASDLNIFIVGAACNSSVATSGTTILDIPGATVTFTTTHTNVVVTCTGFFDISAGAVSGIPTAVGYLFVDGSQQSSQATFLATATSGRGTVGQCWTITLGSSGSHTLKLRGASSISSGTTYTFNQIHTTINALVCDL